MIAHIEPVRRVARRIGLTRNPMCRTTDRVEGFALVATWVIAVVGIPLLVLAGHAWYSQAQAQAAAAVARTTQVQATLTVDAPQAGVTRGAPIDQAQVAATWTAPDGATRTGPVPAPVGSEAGNRVPVWIDGSGAITGAPRDPVELLSTAIAGAIVAGAVWLLLVERGYALVRYLLMRGRFSRLTQEWAVVERGWRQSTS